MKKIRPPPLMRSRPLGRILPLLRAAPTLQLVKNELNVVRFAQALHE
ncbi:MAG: hypothetical protein FWE68_03540 [Defluviitaleaceae bacterium]|nr:hypothetical protein [Defluviitaleaceae bacterium]